MVPIRAQPDDVRIRIRVPMWFIVCAIGVGGVLWVGSEIKDALQSRPLDYGAPTRGEIFYESHEGGLWTASVLVEWHGKPPNLSDGWYVEVDSGRPIAVASRIAAVQLRASEDSSYIFAGQHSVIVHLLAAVPIGTQVRSVKQPHLMVISMAGPDEGLIVE